MGDVGGEVGVEVEFAEDGAMRGGLVDVVRRVG